MHAWLHFAKLVSRGSYGTALRQGIMTAALEEQSGVKFTMYHANMAEW